MATDYPVLEEINSVNNYLKVVADIYKKWGIIQDSKEVNNVLFRGQDIDEPLLPSVLRNIDGKRLNELLIYTSFTSIYKNYTDERFDNSKIELFSFMQHYGIPTRLLDWTENAIMALFFSIESFTNQKTPVVWVINSKGLNELTLPESGGTFLGDNRIVTARLDLIGFLKDEILIPYYFIQHPKYEIFKGTKTLDQPIAFYPISSGNQRIIVQKGVFTVHGCKNDSIENILIKEKKPEYLYKILIDKKAINNIVFELKILGLSPRSVYPDLFGLSKEYRTPFYQC
ncbi:hypothetical protein ES708_29789 [subsurface metagenome]